MPEDNPSDIQRYNVGLLSREEQKLVLVQVAWRIDEIISRPGAVWGPRCLMVNVAIGPDINLNHYYGTIEGWDVSWGQPEDYYDVAAAKLQFTQRTGLPSREAQNHPFLLRKGDCLWPGAVGDNGIWVAGSGLNPNEDEESARLLLDAFHEAGARKIAARVAQDDMASMII
jgi:choline dehydrogenase-like flavoprotein